VGGGWVGVGFKGVGFKGLKGLLLLLVIGYCPS
jgi:hypothetical protein